MADQIGVQIVPADQQFIASTKAVAAAMAAVAAQEEKLGKAAASAGLDQKKFSATYKQLEKQRAEQAAKAAKGAALAQGKAQKTQAAAKAKEAKDQKLATAKREKEQKELAKNDREARDAAIAIGKEFLGVSVAVGVAAAAVAALALKAKEAKDNTRGILDVLTSGRGDKTLQLVDGLAIKLGRDIGETRDQFLQFRRAGLDNKKSAQLIKLAADLNTVDKSGGLASEAVSRVLSFTANGTQTKLQAEAAAKTMALLAKQAHVAGDGTKAAAAGASTLTGALTRIGNVKTQTLESLGDKIQPSIDKAASSFATFVEKLAASKEGQKTLDDVAGAIGKVADALSELSKSDPDSTINQVRWAFDQTKDAGLEVISILKDVGLAAWEIPKAFWIVGNNIVDAVTFIGKSLYNLPGNVKSFVIDPIADMGGHVIDGLVAGIESGASRLVKSVADLASKAKGAFRSALGIHSPSKVFAGYGVNIGAGLNKGLERSMPDGADMADRMLPPARAVAQNVFNAAPPPIFAPQIQGGNSAPSITINLHSKATEEDGRSMRRELDLWWSSKVQQQGGNP